MATFLLPPLPLVMVTADHETCSASRPTMEPENTHIRKVYGWGGRIRTSAWRNQKPSLSTINQYLAALTTSIAP